MAHCERCPDGSWECGQGKGGRCSTMAGPWLFVGRAWMPIGGAEVAIDVYTKEFDIFDKNGNRTGSECRVRLVPMIRTDCTCHDDHHHHHHHFPWDLLVQPAPEWPALAEPDSDSGEAGA